MSGSATSASLSGKWAPGRVRFHTWALVQPCGQRVKPTPEQVCEEGPNVVNSPPGGSFFSWKTCHSGGSAWLCGWWGRHSEVAVARSTWGGVHTPRPSRASSVTTSCQFWVACARGLLNRLFLMEASWWVFAFDTRAFTLGSTITCPPTWLQPQTPCLHQVLVPPGPDQPSRPLGTASERVGILTWATFLPTQGA